MIGFIDTEVSVESKRIVDMACITEKGEYFHSASVSQFKPFFENIDYFCGHNIINHDLTYINKSRNISIDSMQCIDTLFLSTMLYPEKPYHKLVKDDKLYTDQENNPLNDARQAKVLFADITQAFNNLNDELKIIYYNLLKEEPGFSAFFSWLSFSSETKDLEKLIKRLYKGKFCSHADINIIIKENPIELCYSLAMINTKKPDSKLPSWVLMNFPKVEKILAILRNQPCTLGCPYCDTNLEPKEGLKRYFGFESFRQFNGEPLQEKAIQAAIDKESLIAVFPTGGGKSLTYQLPALMSGVNVRGLTIVISPLQSLMKDQVDNLEEKNITSAVTINGLMDPIERSKSIERIENGTANILYIAPESLRSRTIERLLLKRHIVRFVVDEAHCFSSWGHDFRVDYMYIGDFIKMIQEKKQNISTIPVSCFTATAKVNVISDIKDYFQEKLGIAMTTFTVSGKRENLQYKVYQLEQDEDKYQQLRRLIEQKDCPTIIYASRIKTIKNLYERLKNDQYNVSVFHGKMESDKKITEQNKFMKGDTTVMVATNAFGMGVDKKDIGCVIHYDISDSLENYVQESGRAGRDVNLHADCFVLYHEADLNKHFDMLNHSKLNLTEINQIWKALKEIIQKRQKVSQSALEIARKAGWDDGIGDIETRVKTAIAALEDVGYIKRRQNSPRVFANSILVNSVIEANEKIDQSTTISEPDKVSAKRIMKNLISNKYKKRGIEDESESRIDYLSDHLGIHKKDIVRVVNGLREDKVLDDVKDLSCYIEKSSGLNASLKRLETYRQLENFLIDRISQDGSKYNIKELNETAIEKGIEGNPKNIKKLINAMAIQGILKSQNVNNNIIALRRLITEEEANHTLMKRNDICTSIIEYLFDKSQLSDDETQDTDLVHFSVHEMRTQYINMLSQFRDNCSLEDIEDALFHLQKLDLLKIDGGFLVLYNPMTIERIERSNYKKYTKDDYEKLSTFYQNKRQQIHIVGEYATKMASDYTVALQFVDDYFTMKYQNFLNKYFKNEKRDFIDKDISRQKFTQLFGELSSKQLNIIKDKESKTIVVTAGPGSGKTKLLVHKLASVLYMEDIRHEQLLMLTFSRAASSEFKDRLLKLAGSVAHNVEIKTFHSYCFDLLGQMGTLDKTKDVIDRAVEKIQKREVDESKITKMVLVIDEAQDMSKEEFKLIKTLIEKNDDLRVIAVGDGDQNIYEFRGSSSEYLKHLAQNDAQTYELVENYRSKNNLVEMTNQFVQLIDRRMKKSPIIAKDKSNGQITITKYNNQDLIPVVLKDILKQKLSGSTCVMTRNNNQALHMTGLLNKHGVQAKLIEDYKKFNLINLKEIRHFIDYFKTHNMTATISKEAWKKAKHDFIKHHEQSRNFTLCKEIIKRFQTISKSPIYLSDFKEYILESNLSDFIDSKQMLVSTMHKSKGREFDNVFLMIDESRLFSDEEKRLVYVAMTRAKSMLNIYYSGSYFDSFKANNLKQEVINEIYKKDSRRVYQLSHKEVNLGYFKYVQKSINNIKSGDKLEVFDNEHLLHKGNKVLRLSKNYRQELLKFKDDGFQVSDVTVKYLVFWKESLSDEEYLIILPEFTYDKVSEDEASTESNPQNIM